MRNFHQIFNFRETFRFEKRQNMRHTDWLHELLQLVSLLVNIVIFVVDCRKLFFTEIWLSSERWLAFTSEIPTELLILRIGGVRSILRNEEDLILWVNVIRI
jgi:uncharacterized membrane protein